VCSQNKFSPHFLKLLESLEGGGGLTVVKPSLKGFRGFTIVLYRSNKQKDLGV